MLDSLQQTRPPQRSLASPKVSLSLSVELLHSFLSSSKLDLRRHWWRWAALPLWIKTRQPSSKTRLQNGAQRLVARARRRVTTAANQLSIGNRPFFYMWLELVPLSQVTFLCIFVLWPGQPHRRHGLIS